jgi:hypothetical protein
MTRLLACLLLALVLSSQTLSPKLESYDLAEAYEVYTVVISSQFPSTDSRTNRLVIKAETKDSQMCLVPDEPSEKIIGSAIADYIKQNLQIRQLQRKFNLNKPYTLLADEEMTSSVQLSPDKRHAFHPIYPDFGGLIQLSAVGFNADKTIAVVFYEQSCGPLCGEGEFHVLQKQAGKWHPFAWKGSSCTWVS